MIVLACANEFAAADAAAWNSMAALAAAGLGGLGVAASFVFSVVWLRRRSAPLA